jgi:cellulose synthase/poly-beta-1,6-N-acetylglucosamine synthase-like glycosyltransferase
VVFELVFWISILALIHSYVIYPILVTVLAIKKKDKHPIFQLNEELPSISIIMAVRNEEKIIGKKIESVLNCDYPIDKLHFLIGSDASEDGTDQIISTKASISGTIEFERFDKRAGKVHIINHLASKCKDEILVLTDAHAIFEKNSLFNLVKHFRDPEIHLVGGQMKNSKHIQGNVVFQEMMYYNQEYKVKLAESRLWGCMMGAFGSFYAIKKKYWTPVPHNFICDDFYISMKAIQMGGKAVYEPEAIVFENVSGNMNEEFKRKARIATGNFQNLSVLYPILFSRRMGLSFCFFSHKVLRWLGPIFIISSMISLSVIFYENLTYTILFIIMLLMLTALIIDFFLKKIQIHIVLLRFIAHFFYMNLAILTGMFRFLKGVKSNVWEPTKRDE